MNNLWYIPPSDFMSKLDPSESAKLLTLGKSVNYKKNDLIFQAGSPGQQVYFLLDGRAKIYQLSPGGKEVILWFCFQGEMFGLAEVYRGGRREVYARACSDMKVLQVSQENFKKFIAENSSAALLTIDLLSCRLRVLGDMLLNIATDDVTSRIIKLITRLNARYGKKIGNDIYLDIPLTHQEIADMISSSRQTVSTILGDMKKKGILSIRNHRIHINEPATLEHMMDNHADKVVELGYKS